ATYELPTTFRRTLDAAFEAPLRVVAACLGAEIDKIMTTTERAVASTTFPIATTVVEEGTIAGWRFVFEGRSRESAVVTIDTAWHLHDEWGIGAGWPVGEGWDLTIDAQPELRLRWEVGPATGARSRSPHRMDAAAAHLVNSVPVVVQAPPGIMTPADLRVAAGRWAHG
ncbi:MAG: hypothetical protein GX610_09645, partial [Rhodococcus sp.]|nr:hypothetical protein [Rhodococcus sp. (in: high G+C Gram-positive bacteria)]